MSKVKNVTGKNVTTKEVTKKENLDTVNIYGTVKNKVSKLNETKEGINKERMYKFSFEKSDPKFDSKYKALKSKIRKESKKFANNGLFFLVNNQIEKFEQTAEKFIAFYTENFTVNDFSIESFARKNSDLDNYELKEEFLSKVKMYVANKETAKK